ncbi:MAG: S-layer homology domain-containing protein [Bryobacterales bacterium]|nr:S-layer homology domain-containing protein [Bryobacterales bacterium]
MDKLIRALLLTVPFFPFAALIASEAVPVRVPFIFEENHGQVERDARFTARAPGAGLLLGRGVRFRTEKSSFELEFAGARGDAGPRGEGRLSARVHYYRGRDRSRWIENLPAFRSVRYPGLYPGIDLLYHGSNGRLEYDFELAPGVDYRKIAVRFHGVRLRLSPEGDLLLGTPSLRHHRPAAYQLEGGRRVNVAAWFRLEGETVRFALAPYDRRKALVIDPVLGFSAAVALQSSGYTFDSNGNSYVGGADSPYGGNGIYLKLDSQGKLVYKTYVTGFSGIIPGPVAADSSGNLFATGSTNSADFPVSSNPCGGVSQDAYLTKLSATGIILASRCLGGSDTETATGIGLDSTGAPIIAGGTLSSDFPTTAGSFQSAKKSPNKGSSGFVAKFDPVTLATSYATYFGSLGETSIGHLAVDGSGAAIIAGGTEPSGFPITQGAFQMEASAALQALPSNFAPFAARLSVSGASLVYATFLPLASDSGIFPSMRLAADAAGNATFLLQETTLAIAGLTILRLNATGTTAMFNKTIPPWVGPSSLDVDSGGNLLLAGSDTNAQPLTPDGLQARPGNSLVLKLDSSASTVTFATVLNLRISAARLGPGGSIFAGGQLIGPLPITPGASDSSPAGFGVIRLTPGNGCTPTLDPSFGSTVPVSGATLTLNVTAPANCTWMATSDVAILSNPNLKNYGTGNGLLTAVIPGLSGESGRRIVLSLSPASQYVLTQGQPPPCVPQFYQGTIMSASPAGGILSVSVQPLAGCTFPVSSDVPWITLPGQTSVANGGNAYLQVAANTGAARTGTVSIGGQNIIVNQTPCSYTLSPTLPQDGMAMTGRVGVYTDAGCTWSASTTVPWIHLGAGSSNRTGPATFTIDLDPNPTGASRGGDIKVGIQTATVVQPPIGCTTSATASSNTFSGSGGSSSIAVAALSTSGGNCTINANLLSPAHLTSPSTVTNQGTFQFTVPANNTGEPAAFRASLYSNNTTIYIPFIQSALNQAPPFTDVPPGNVFFDHITILKNKDVTRGCTFDAQKYCPDRPITRAEMAMLLAKAAYAYPPSNSTPYFEDVLPSHPAFVAIQSIRKAGITLGCSTIPSKFCPDETLTRGQMAALIVRAKLGSESFSYPSTPYFQDVPANNLFFRHIQKLKDLGITLGCGDGNFCVNAPNTRGEMAAFLVRAFYSGF